MVIGWEPRGFCFSVCFVISFVLMGLLLLPLCFLVSCLKFVLERRELESPGITHALGGSGLNVTFVTG